MISSYSNIECCSDMKNFLHNLSECFETLEHFSLGSGYSSLSLVCKHFASTIVCFLPTSLSSASVFQLHSKPSATRTASGILTPVNDKVTSAYSKSVKWKNGTRALWRKVGEVPRKAGGGAKVKTEVYVKTQD